MAYSENPEDDLMRKEFAITATNSKLHDKFTSGLRKAELLYSYQLFIKHFMNPHTANRRLLVEYGTGVGKTRIGAEVMCQFLNMATINLADASAAQPSAILISFNKYMWRDTFTRVPALGYVTEAEIERLSKLNANRQNNITAMENYKSYKNMLYRRVTADPNRPMRFIGYKKLRNDLYIKNIDGTETINEAYLHTFDNSLLVCDEIQYAWNSEGLNEWGIALVAILSHAVNIRGMFLTATPFNTSADEITSIIDMLGGDSKNILPPLSNLPKIARELRGKVVHMAEQSIGYPERMFMGEANKAVPYLKFVTYTLSPPHARIITTMMQHTGEYKPTGSFISDVYFGDNITDVRQIQSTMAVSVSDDTVPIITGNFLKYKNLPTYSGKFTKILDIISGIADEKIMIYHNLVHITGVILIGRLLRENGYIGEYDIPDNNTKCYMCNRVADGHTTDHMYYPARYTLYHSDIKQEIRGYSLATYVSSANKDGHIVKLLVGGPAISEGLNFTAIQHLIVASIPSSIPELIQLMGRAARLDSHIELDANKRVARFYLLIDDIGYELAKYATKMATYADIQIVDKVLHEVAMDGTYVRDYNIGVQHPIEPLPFQPLKPKGILSTATFDIYFKRYEIDYIVMMIKRLFTINPVWDVDTLYAAVKKPPFETKIDTSVFERDYVLIGLYIVMSTDHLFTVSQPIYSQIKCIIDGDSSNVFDNIPFMIKQIGKYICRVPVSHGHTAYIQPSSPYQKTPPIKTLHINMRSVLTKIANRVTYGEHRALFIKKYGDAKFSDMNSILTMYDLEFHTQLLSDCIKYVHDVLIGTGTIGEHHDFLFKMLYFYNNLHLVLFASGVKKSMHYMWPRVDFATASSVNARIECLKNTLSTTECSWLPSSRINVYKTAVTQFSEYLEKPSGKVPANLLPVGHVINKTTMIYDGRWHELNESVLDPMVMVENDIIIGYHVRHPNDIAVKFKIRPPVQRQTTTGDARKLERGISCTSKPKRLLSKLSKKLGLVASKTNISACADIEARLIWMELNERNNGTNVKYFYLVFEERPV
jgi:hypothetical protein